jgi:hypothetical protein
MMQRSSRRLPLIALDPDIPVRAQHDIDDLALRVTFKVAVRLPEAPRTDAAAYSFVARPPVGPMISTT